MNERGHIVEALIEQWHAIHALATGFNESHWAAPTPCPGWSAHDIIAHIVGTELSLTGHTPPECGAASNPYVHNDIGALNQRWVEHFRTVTGETLLRRFDAVIGERIDALAMMSDEQFHAPSWTPEGPGTYARFMRIRVFDCWMHEQDLRDAIGAPGGTDTAAARITLAQMIDKLGYIVGKRACAPQQSTITFAFTGPLARTVSLLVNGSARLLTDPPATASVTLTLATSLFTRLYGGRVRADEHAKAIRVEGDHLLGHRILDAPAITI